MNTVDIVNLRFNVKPNYDQQQIQQLADDLKESQRQAEKTRKELDANSKSLVSMQEKLAGLRQRREELLHQESPSKKEQKELEKLNVSIADTIAGIDETRDRQQQLSQTFTDQVQHMQALEQQMQQATQSADLYKMSLNDLRQRARDLSAVLNNLAPDNEAYAGLKQELDDVNRRMKDLRKETLHLHDNSDLSQLSVSQLTERLQALETAFRDCDPNDEEFNRYANDIKATKSRIGELNQKLKETEDVLEQQEGPWDRFLRRFSRLSVISTFTGGVASKLQDMTSQATELARTAEGVEMAFQRIDQPGLLDNLREATHGTVSDLELMRQAVQFKDFNLDVEQLGSFLAYAQQKAKDTGQSVDYLVNSIVTGLGRKSKQILDNLGISASEIDEEMKTAGDMTQAVANIIQRNMAAAGDYVETAADRAARATAQQQNAMLELGRKLLPIAEAVANVFNVILTGGAKVLGFLAENHKIIITLTAAVVAYTAVVKAHAAAEALRAAKTWLAEKAQRALNLAQKASPMGLFVGLVSAGAAALGLFSSKADEATTAQNAMNRAEASAAEQMAAEEGKIRLLTATINDNTLSVDQRRQAIDELKKIIPEYNALIDEEGRLTRNNTKAIDDYLKRRRQQLVMAAYEEELTELYKQRAKAEMKLQELEKEYGEDGLFNIHAGVIGVARASLAEINNSITAVEQRMTEAGQKIAQQAAATADTINEIGEVTVTGHKRTKTSPTRTTTTPEKDDTAEKQLQAEHQRQLTLLKKQQHERTITEEQYHQQAYQAEMDYLTRLYDLKQKAGADEQELTQIEAQKQDALISEANRRYQQNQQNMQDALATLEMNYRADQLAMDQLFWQGDLGSEADYHRQQLQAEEDYQQQRISVIRQYGGSTQQAEDELAKARLEAARTTAEQRQRELEQQMAKNPKMSTAEKLQLVQQNQELLGWQRTQQMKTQILQEEEQKRTEIQQAAISSANQLLQSTTALFSALQQRETAQVDAKYKRLIAAAKKQGRDTTKLEEQQEAERMEIQKRYAQKQFKLQVLQIISATAQAIANVWKQWAATPPIAAALSAVAAAQGAMQLATAKAQADQAAGLYEGGYSEGYTRSGDPRRQAGVIPVHQSEFVANHHTVGNRQLRPLLDVIDRHQRRGDVQLLNATRLLEEAYGRGRYGGGYTAATATPAVVASPATEATTNLLPVLERIEQNTARSLTVRGLRQEISHEEQLERNAHR